jgi:transcriptional regulator with XRE-family HTH domain
MRRSTAGGKNPIEDVRQSMDPRYLEFATRLRAARASKKLTQSQLSKSLGKPQSYISKLETAELSPDLIETLCLCRALRISLDCLIPAEFGQAIVGSPSASHRRRKRESKKRVSSGRRGT